MSEQPLHLKYRPRTFDEFLGNESVIESLRLILSREEGIPHSFLFYGPSGCGKTTLARIIASELGCSNKEYHEYNVADVRGIDTIRDIIYQCKFAPLVGKVKVYVLDEFHQSTKDAQNAILKVLEDTPKHVYFILCTTEPEKILKTIRTRCTSFQLSPLPRPKLIRLLKYVCKQEGVELPREAYQEIAKASGGSPRQALVILDSVIDIEDDNKLLEAIQDSCPSDIQIIDICKVLLDFRKSPELRWKEVSKILQGMKEDHEQVRYMILSYLSKALLGKVDDRVAEMLGLFQESFMYTGKAGLIYNLYLACKIK